MKNKPRIVIDLVDHMQDIAESMPHTLSAAFLDQEEQEQLVNVLDDDMFKNYFEFFFYSYNMISFKELEDSEVVNRFNNMWRIFQIEEKENLNKIVQAYYWKYVPVYNYDRTEIITDVRTGNETDARKLDYALKQNEDTEAGKITETFTPDGAKVTTKTPQGEYSDSVTYDDNITKEDVSTMDSANYRSKNKVTNDTHTDVTTRSYNNYEEETVETVDNYSETKEKSFDNYKATHKELAHLDKDDNTHTYNEVTDTHNARMYGNIGVTTNMDMINQEFEGRIHELGYEFLKRFFDKFFVML